MGITLHTADGVTVSRASHFDMQIIAIGFDTAPSTECEFDLTIGGTGRQEIFRCADVVSGLRDMDINRTSRVHVIYFVAIFGITPHVIGAQLPRGRDATSGLGVDLIRHHVIAFRSSSYQNID